MISSLTAVWHSLPISYTIFKKVVLGIEGKRRTEEIHKKQ